MIWISRVLSPVSKSIVRISPTPGLKNFFSCVGFERGRLTCHEAIALAAAPGVLADS